MSRKSRYTKEVLEPIVRESYSMAEVLRKLTLSYNGGSHSMIQSRIRAFGISTDHFTGQGWAKGKNKDNTPGIMASARVNRWPHDKVFCENSEYTRTIRDRYLQLNPEYKCQICGITQWMEKPIALHVDHINGIHNDNRVENLRLLCPNCHQQTDTWGNSNKRDQGRVA